MICQRCGAEAELGLCPGPCGRLLCMPCYDGDQGGDCRPASLVQRNEAMRALRGSGMPVDEIAERMNLSRETIFRITREAARV